MRIRYLAMILLGAVLSAGLPYGWAADKKPATSEKKPAAADKKAPTESLYGITWHKSLDDALKAAQKSSPPKPVFVWRMLGDLCGKT